jgi:CheY-like chemotaxis protein
VARTIAIRLHPYDIEVKSAENGMRGYLRTITEQPNLIVLDLKMPSGDGYYVLTKLKANTHTQHIPVIVLTVETHPGIRRQLVSQGVNGFLTKPVHWRELFVEMEKCIQLPKNLLRDYKLSQETTSVPS